ncbi:uncharacterized protein N7503_002031 [Penicillium pulvis]|uniref:uncharacterized protein n=1 Tax=Penicillium pulvis TaxID=1562058 RepID=UPI0025489A14|nr:uncharacterized protein N7503_002031 [Penicillium pulvis]KAJ5809813.1 hypothetical protein N7503_002031 [Penicillium pulvis]
MHFASLLFLAIANTTFAKSSTGCKKELPPAFPNPGKSTPLNLPGTDRDYRLYIPRNYDHNNPTPLYISLHGANRNMDEQERLSQFSNPLFNPDGIAVYPNSRNGYWLSNPKAHTSRPNDLDYMYDLITHLEDKLCIDTNRIYAAGKSNGAGFAGVMACNATVGSKIAAFASVSGGYYNISDIPGLGPCSPAPRDEGYPFLEFHGTKDTTSPYDGGGRDDKRPVIDVLEEWAGRNGCPKDAEWSSNVTVFEHPLVKHASWDCGGKKGIVQHYREGDWGHCWASTVPNGDTEAFWKQCSLGKYVFNATEIIFDFFSGYQLKE